MGYRTLRDCLNDLEATGQLARIEEEIDPRLEAAEIHRRVFVPAAPRCTMRESKAAAFRW